MRGVRNRPWISTPGPVYLGADPRKHPQRTKEMQPEGDSSQFRLHKRTGSTGGPSGSDEPGPLGDHGERASQGHAPRGQGRQKNYTPTSICHWIRAPPTQRRGVNSPALLPCPTFRPNTRLQPSGHLAGGGHQPHEAVRPPCTYSEDASFRKPSLNHPKKEILPTTFCHPTVSFLVYIMSQD